MLGTCFSQTIYYELSFAQSAYFFTYTGLARSIFVFISLLHGLLAFRETTWSCIAFIHQSLQACKYGKVYYFSQSQYVVYFGFLIGRECNADAFSANHSETMVNKGMIKLFWMVQWNLLTLNSLLTDISITRSPLYDKTSRTGSCLSFVFLVFDFVWGGHLLNTNTWCRSKLSAPTSWRELIAQLDN